MKAKKLSQKVLQLVARITDNKLLKGGKNRSVTQPAHCKANDQINVNSGRILKVFFREKPGIINLEMLVYF